jgi:MFS transporter, FHS family, glucose/mannose:H+ symporter
MSILSFLTRQRFFSARRGQILVTLVHLAFVLTGVVTTFLGPLLPALSTRWQLSDARAGYFFTAQFFGSIAGVILSGFLLPRRGFRFSLALGYVSMAAGVMGLALGEWRLALLGTFVSGLGLGLVIPASNLLISSMNPDYRAAAISALNFCWGAGAVLAPYAISVVERRNILWDSVIALAAALLLAAITMIAAPVTAPSSAKRQAEIPWRNTGQRRLTAVVAALFFLYVGTETSLGGWIALLVKRLAVGHASLWLPAPSIFWGGLVLGRGISPLLLRRVRERTVALLGLTTATIAICVLTLAPNRPSMMAAACVAGLGLAPVFPVMVALLSRFGEMERRIAGPMFAVAGLGGAVLPWLVGVVSTGSGSLQTGLAVPLIASVLLLGLYGRGILYRPGTGFDRSFGPAPTNTS